MREDRIIRTVRCRNDQKPGILGALLTAVGDQGAEVGEIRLIKESLRAMVRDITIYCDDEAQLARTLAAMEVNPGTVILAVRDEVLELHQDGKIVTRSRYPVESLYTLRRVYTPGVASVSRAIAGDPTLARQYTSIHRMVAIVTDGTAILGLGDIGPVAGMPVMEGKAMLLETLVGLSGIPILLDTRDVDEIVATVEHIAPTFGAIQLEDISAPRCFEIEERLVERLGIPVMHDDQHGTAVVTLAALTSACRTTCLESGFEEATIGQIGLGAAGYAIGRMLMNLTGHPVLGADLSADALAHFETAGGRPSDLAEIMATCDIVIATTGVPGLIRPEMVRKGQIILALSNPNPEIEPELALERGAAFAADGKSVNNLLGFPGIFRGVLEADAPQLTQEMYVAAARAIATQAPEDALVPNPLEREVHLEVARAVARTAVEQGLARADYIPLLEI